MALEIQRECQYERYVLSDVSRFATLMLAARDVASREFVTADRYFARLVRL